MDIQMRTVEEINEIEEMYELLEGTANMLRGMMFDPSIKDAIISKVNEIDQACVNSSLIMAIMTTKNRNNTTPAELKHIRHRLNLNTADFGARVGVSGRAIEKYEQGVRKIPRPVEMLIEQLKQAPG